MPQPQLAIASNRLIAQFGGRPLPNGQGTMGYLDLNDLTTWLIQEVHLPDSNRDLGVVQQAWRARASYISEDFLAKTFSLDMWVQESLTVPYAALKAKLTLAGEQFLTFDNATATLVKCKPGKPTVLRKIQPYLWSVSLDFVCREPWAKDLTATTIAPTAVSGSVTPGTTTNIVVTYAGSVFCEPVYTLTIPVGNTAPISRLTLANTMSGDSVTVNFAPALAAGTAYTLTIDSGAISVVDQSGNNYDVTGASAFPLLYGPAGQAQTIAATLIATAGTTTGVTLGVTYSNRWEI